MKFGNPEYLLLFFPLCIFFVWAIKRRFGIGYNTALLSRVPIARSFWWRIKYYLPHGAAFCVCGALLIALATPYKNYHTVRATTKANIVLIVIDVSMSMSMSTAEGRGIDNIKSIAHEFVSERGKSKNAPIVDPTGIAAYSSQAGIIIYPTIYNDELDTAIALINAQMFGSRTAIGLGIFTGIYGLLETTLGKNFDWVRLRNAIEIMHTDNEQRDDTEIIAEAVRISGNNKNKAIILFTDGYHNEGFDPEKSLWFAERLGIRVHFIAFKPTGYIGLDKKEAEERKKRLILGVTQTGGSYFESTSYKEIHSFFKRVRSMEQATVSYEHSSEKQSLYFYPLIIALCALAFLVLWENIFIKIP
ncbi:MAG: VWA domain-containing protein [Parcubacteria group bacterium]|nr:VWA domain-containing protein [Parcubacteria group bacterium]